MAANGKMDDQTTQEKIIKGFVVPCLARLDQAFQLVSCGNVVFVPVLYLL